jgi:hypothetical protein
MSSTCAYCKHHIWSDENTYHVCIVDPDHSQEKANEETCPKFKHARRFQNHER